MSDNQKFQPRILFSVSLTLAGISLGLLLAVLAVWADYESTSYGFMKRASTPLQGLDCPIFIGRNERRTVSIRVSNPTERTLSPSISTDISTPLEPVSEIDFFRLAPGEQATAQRTVGPENIDLGSFIFVKALVFAAYPLPDRENTCGIFVLPIAQGSSLVLTLGTTLSLLLMSSGVYLLYKNGPIAGRRRSIPTLAILTVLLMLFSFIGWWPQAILLLVLLILILVIMLGGLLKF
jgi:hypothetical protein